MSSEAITRNDLTAILNEVLPPTPSEYKKLLWTNPNSGDPFSAQTISIDLSEYDAIEVVAQHWSNNGTTASMVAKVGEIGVTTVPNYDNSTIAIRSFTVSTSGVQFTDGRNVTGSSISTNSHASIPRRIYGIKYERVNPPQAEISDVVIEQGTNANGSYRKWESGVLEQWGTEASANASTHTVALPTSFKADTPYLVVGTNTSGTQANFMTSNSSASSFTIYPTASVRLFWIAIGVWK